MYFSSALSIFARLFERERASNKTRRFAGRGDLECERSEFYCSPAETQLWAMSGTFAGGGTLGFFFMKQTTSVKSDHVTANCYARGQSWSKGIEEYSVGQRSNG